MANLTIQNQELRAQLESVAAQLTNLQNTIQQLSQNNGNNNRRNTNSNNNRNTNANSNRNSNNPRRPPTHYCWTHGGTINPFHTSQRCQRPAEGHVREATLEDRRGGNNRNT